jgi:hypothetical protein
MSGDSTQDGETLTQPTGGAQQWVLARTKCEREPVARQSVRYVRDATAREKRWFDHVGSAVVDNLLEAQTLVGRPWA